MRPLFPYLFPALFLACLPLSAEELPLLLEEDFSAEDVLDGWLPTQADRWQITDTKGDQVRALHLLGKSGNYNPPHRSPHSILLLRDQVVGDFVLTAKVQTLQTTRGHRDMCIFFGWQDPANFYYVHLGENPDPNSSQIFIVDDAPRTAITEENSGGIPWEDGTWHDVKVVRTVADGTIDIYFDDMETPCKVAHDKSFAWGMIGLGSFDDLGMWDDVVLRGIAIEDENPVLPDVPGGDQGEGAAAPPAAADNAIAAVSADTHQEGNGPANAFDGDPDTRWAAQGDGHWLQFRLQKTTRLSSIGLGFTHGERDYSFDIRTSMDGSNWSEPVSFQSRGNELSTYEFPDREANLVRIVSHGSKTNGWANIHTVQVGGIAPSPEVEEAARSAGGNADFEVIEWAKAPAASNGVAISLDDHGRAYVARTDRRKVSSLDIRQHRDWVHDDLSFTNIEDRRAYYHERFADDPSRGWLPDDRNGDGARDWKDLTVQKDSVSMLSPGADPRLLGEYHSEVTGIAAGVLAVGDRVFVAAEPDIWLYSDEDGDGTPETGKVIATGFSLHIGQGGHNLSGLALGPDGRVYWSVADKGYSVKTAEGREFSAPNSGAVFRCELDGTGVERFALGVRNAQELAFDDCGNLFSMDNDGDYKGEMERGLYITEGSMHGWRLNWQWLGTQRFIKISGLPAYNPWMEERLYLPDSEDFATYLTPTIGNFGPGPCGFCGNPGTALSEALADSFFMTNNKNEVRCFRFRPEGASFRFEEGTKIPGGNNNTGLAIGPDGAIYASSYNGSGSVYRFDVTEEQRHPLREEVAGLLASDLSQLPAGQLTELLGHPDQRVRMKAQLELVGRGNDGLAVLNSVLESESDRLPQLHAIWGIGMASRQEPSALALLAPAWDSDDPEVLALAAKTTGDLGRNSDLFRPELLRALANPEQVRPAFFAAIALGSRGDADATPALVTFLADHAAADPYLRHAAIMGLTGCATSDQLTALADHESREFRRAAVVSLRRQRAPEVAVFLDDKDELVLREAARAIHDDASIPEALPALAQLLARDDLRDAALLRRSINAALRTPTTESVDLLTGFLEDGHVTDPKLRRTALASLLWWAAPPHLDAVEGRFREHAPRDRAPADAAVAKLAPTIAADPELTEVLLNGVAALGRGEWLEALDLDFGAEPPNLQVRHLTAAAAVKSPDLSALVTAALESDHREVREEARRHAAAAGIPILDVLLATLASDEGEGGGAAVTELAKLDDPRARERFAQLVEDYRTGKTPPEWKLELWQAAADQGIELPPTPDRFVAGGDPARGSKLVTSHTAAGCIRCHEVGKAKLEIAIGAPLDGIGAEHDPAYLAAALLEPSRDLAPGFGNLVASLRDGTQVTGLLQSQSDDSWTITLPDGTARTIPRADVEEHTLVSLMPPMEGILQPAEIRDIVAYLTTLK